MTYHSPYQTTPQPTYVYQGQNRPIPLGEPMPNTHIQNTSFKPNLNQNWHVRPGTKQEQEQFLKGVDVYVLIDRSKSMSWKGRWGDVNEIIKHIVKETIKYDPDGVEVAFFGSEVKWIKKNVESEKQVTNLFNTYKPEGVTYLSKALEEAFGKHLDKRGNNSDQRSLVIVITDGAPTDREGDDIKGKRSVIKAIRGMHNKLDQTRFYNMQVKTKSGMSKSIKNTIELGLLFFQVGDDEEATDFLQKLDDRLNLTIDFVDTKSLDSLQSSDKIRNCFVDAFYD